MDRILPVANLSAFPRKMEIIFVLAKVTTKSHLFSKLYHNSLSIKHLKQELSPLLMRKRMPYAMWEAMLLLL